MQTRRALLFMPGDDRHKIEKGAALGADAVIMDLEDGVALNRKVEARQQVAAALREVHFHLTERWVRINALHTGWAEEDVQAVAPAHPDGVVLPKVQTAQQVQDISHHLSLVEHKHDWPEGHIRLLAIIETARGVMNLREIVESDPRLDGLIFGAEDLAGDLGATRTTGGAEVAYARGAVVLHAKAYGLQAFDTPFVDLSDMTGLESQTREALYMGYDGKLAIHPRQVALIQKVFTPDADAIRRAQHLIAAHHAQQAAGSGVFELDGRMVDQPMVRAAETVLARARAAGIDVDSV
jgi:citrate lyase beta subunit